MSGVDFSYKQALTFLPSWARGVQVYANASALTSDSFVSGGSVTDPYAFIVRFRGMDDGGSDKVPANQLPSPGAMALLGLSGLMTRRRRA
jgi:MYXO-CTERM domain-containing protein